VLVAAGLFTAWYVVANPDLFDPSRVVRVEPYKEKEVEFTKYRPQYTPVGYDRKVVGGNSKESKSVYRNDAGGGFVIIQTAARFQAAGECAKRKPLVCKQIATTAQGEPIYVLAPDRTEVFLHKGNTKIYVQSNGAKPLSVDELLKIAKSMEERKSL
jgi:Domain of unknown function (DUF4367)